MKLRTIEELIKDMPSAYQGRGRTLYRRGQLSGWNMAVADLESRLQGTSGKPLHSIVDAWLEESRGKEEI